MLLTPLLQRATAKLLLPRQNGRLIDTRRHEQQPEAELSFLLGGRKTPGAHAVKHGGGEPLVRYTPLRKAEVRHPAPRRDGQTDIKTPHEARVLFAFLVVDVLKLRQKGKNLLLQHVKRATRFSGPLAGDHHPQLFTCQYTRMRR
jgi:hypothetical protein